MTSIDDPLDDLLVEATECINLVLEKYNETLPVITPVEPVEIIPFQRVEKASGLPEYINYYRRTRDGVITRHGYYVYHSPSKKSKYIMTSIDEKLTPEMLVKATDCLKILIDDYNKKLSDDAKKVLKDLENLNI
jgi:hypothetical protein